MPVENPSFETAGSAPGLAEHWTLRTATARERIAGFGPAPHRAWEDFERWFSLVPTLEPGNVALALFDPLAEGYEDFEDAWDNDVYLTALPTGNVLTAPFGGGAVEDLEDGWSTVPYARAWEEVTGATGVFDGEPREDFEDQWRSNQSFAWSWGSVAASAARFDAGAQVAEDFENDWSAAATL